MILTVTTHDVEALQARFDSMRNKTPGCEKRKEEFRALQKEANALFVKFQESEKTSLQQGDLSTRSIASADTAVDSPKPALLKLFQDLKGERKLQSWGIGLTSQESKAMEANLKKLQAKTTGSSTQRSASKSVAQMGDVNPSKVKEMPKSQSVQHSTVAQNAKIQDTDSLLAVNVSVDSDGEIEEGDIQNPKVDSLGSINTKKVEDVGNSEILHRATSFSELVPKDSTTAVTGTKHSYFKKAFMGLILLAFGVIFASQYFKRGEINKV